MLGPAEAQAFFVLSLVNRRNRHGENISVDLSYFQNSYFKIIGVVIYKPCNGRQVGFNENVFI